MMCVWVLFHVMIVTSFVLLLNSLSVIITVLSVHGWANIILYVSTNSTSCTLIDPLRNHITMWSIRLHEIINRVLWLEGDGPGVSRTAVWHSYRYGRSVECEHTWMDVPAMFPQHSFQLGKALKTSTHFFFSSKIRKERKGIKKERKIEAAHWGVG